MGVGDEGHFVTRRTCTVYPKRMKAHTAREKPPHNLLLLGGGRTAVMSEDARDVILLVVLLQLCSVAAARGTTNYQGRTANHASCVTRFAKWITILSNKQGHD